LRDARRKDQKDGICQKGIVWGGKRGKEKARHNLKVSERGIDGDELR